VIWGRIRPGSEEESALPGIPCVIGESCQNRRKGLGVRILVGALVVLLSSHVGAAETSNTPSLPDTAVPTPLSGSQGEGEETFVDTQKWGVGFTAVMIPAVIPSSGGFGDVRYWFSNGFGIDGGAGFALPSVSPTVSYAALANVEGMWAFVERPHLVIFLDFDALPILFPLKNYTSTTMAFSLPVSLGIGIEHAFSQYPKATLYVRLNPLSFNIVSSGAAGSTPPGGIRLPGNVHEYGGGHSLLWNREMKVIGGMSFPPKDLSKRVTNMKGTNDEHTTRL